MEIKNDNMLTSIPFLLIKFLNYGALNPTGYGILASLSR